MLEKIARGFITLLGVIIGFGITNIAVTNDYVQGINPMELYTFFALLFGIIFFILAPQIRNIFKQLILKIENELSDLKPSEIFISIMGFTIAMILAFLISSIFRYIPIQFIGTILTLITYIVLGYLGIRLALNYFEGIDLLDNIFARNKKIVEEQKDALGPMPKILDTSVIIDGRILDLSKTGFIEGDIIIPEFILDELQHIADSSDDLKRKKGRRGLDILKSLQDDDNLSVKVIDIDFDINEVDGKLIKLASKIRGAVVTNDYNLNKVALVQDIKVLNINELANAVKPVVIPGEKMEVDIIKEGKGNDQGVGYLDDGTMIVVEGGQRYIGQKINTEVTSVLQTDAGRMIFVRPD